MSETIESILQEKRVFQPHNAIARHARITTEKYKQLQQRAEENHETYWGELAQNNLDWFTPFTQVLDQQNPPFFKWFSDGELNVSYNCLDRHLASQGDKTAIIFEGEPGDIRKLSYRELHRDVCRFANALKAQNIKTGDRVIIYMPMTPEAVIAMQACARIGAIHSVVFGGFSAESLKDRINDSGAKLVVTANGGNRGGQIVHLKDAVDKALSMGCPTIQKVLVYKRCDNKVLMQAGRDIDWQEAIEDQSDHCDAKPLNAEHPLFLLYTSGSTGKPKGIQHSSGGYLLNAMLTSQWVFDLQNNDIFWCTADVGWITGHTYVAYGPLAAGATILMYEGAPTVPDGGRFWKICQDHAVTVFYTAPTAIRALMRLGDNIPAQYNLSKLRILGTVGEPINPEAWIWYHQHIGHEKCPIIDTWWQTETGAHMLTPLPGVTPTKPGSCTKALPGIDADVVDEHGNSITDPHKGGYLVIKKPWPSMLRTIWGDDQRYIDTYWARFNNRYYLAGDSAHKDDDGYFWIMGRIDDVVNISGHRLGTMEVESALVAHPRVAEAAVVGYPHDIKGEAIFAFVVLRGSRPTETEETVLTRELRNWVSEQIGPIAKPENIRYADNLPKTRSGKIMRRLLKSIAKGETITGDITTLENPGILKQLQGKG